MAIGPSASQPPRTPRRARPTVPEPSSRAPPARSTDVASIAQSSAITPPSSRSTARQNPHSAFVRRAAK
eukprot:10169870-Lingulodinium_polyedra.AAC.1